MNNKLLSHLKSFSLVFFALISLAGITRAADGDTLKVRTFEFGQAKEGWFKFPPKGDRYEKILLNYKFNCPCSEYDYLAHIYLDQFYKDGIRVFFKDTSVKTDRFEIFRFITPFGGGLVINHGNGFTWTVDVSDFEPLLHDSVFLVNDNIKLDVELTFDFIKGTPPRDVVSFRKMWNFRGNYNKDFEQLLPPVPEMITDQQTARLKIIQSGHGWDNDDNCAEFCDKMGTVKVNNTSIYTRHIWRNDCGSTPLHPQPGTWLTNRSNWCPGADVRYYDYELTDYLRSADSIPVDYDMEYYDVPVTGDIPNYMISSYLIKYGLPNFKLDAAIEDILSPSKKDAYSRRNPVCNNPVIIIRNTGSDNLSSLDIHYGIRGAAAADYTWHGTLKFLDTAHVRLPSVDWGEWTGEARFDVEISNPNGGTDGYAANNMAFSQVESAPEYPDEVLLELKTNLYANEQYELYLTNMNGENIVFRKDMSDTTKYIDSLTLEDGCYELRLINKLNYGLSYWMLNDQLGSGYIKLTGYNKEYTSFNPDFGSDIFCHFTVGPKPLGVKSSDSLVFGNVDLNNTISKIIEVTPKNVEGLMVANVTIPFSEKKGLFFTTQPDIANGPVNLAYGEKMIITVDFKPVKEGKVSSIMQIVTNDEKYGTLPVYISATGKDPNSVDDNSFEISQPYIEPISNPVNGKTNVRFSSGYSIETESRLMLYDMLGTGVILVHEGTTTPVVNERMLDVSSLPQGVYYLSLSTAGSAVSVPVVVVK